jgi:hypothetical protein
MTTKQTNIVANPSRGLVFFEGEELCYNYKTNQWTKVPAYDTYGMFGVDSNTQDIGLVVYSAGSVDLQIQDENDVAQAATLATGATDPNEGGRVVVTGVRPLINGGSPTVQVGCQTSLTASTDWSTATSPNSRTGMANFRKEGRYVRVSVSVSGGFNHIVGADVDFTPAGSV